MDAPSPPLLQFENVSKRFPGVQALQNVRFEVHPNQFHALVGENGAGKSTLMKLLAGTITPDEGAILLDGVPVELNSLMASRSHGIDIVYQEIELAPNLSVMESVFLGREITRNGKLDYGAMFAATAQALDSLRLYLNPDTLIEQLSAAEKQLVQIARALVGNVRLLILDEPTSALSDHETERLFEILLRLKRGGTTLLYVSHKLEEIFRLADFITVLRDGKHVSTQSASELTSEKLIALMAGAPLAALTERQPLTRQPEPIFEATGLSVPGLFEPLDLSLYAGEVTGMFGIVGAKRTELAQTVFGLQPQFKGQMRMAGKPYAPRHPIDAVEAGIGLAPEDRKTQGLILEMSVMHNASLASLGEIARGGVLQDQKEWQLARRFVEALRIAAFNLEASVKTLSGGNQQKVVLAKWLAIKPRLLILDEPTKGIDVQAKREAHRLIRELASQGMAVWVISSDLEEALSVSDRLLIMREGRITADLRAENVTREEALHHALLDAPALKKG